VTLYVNSQNDLCTLIGMKRKVIIPSAVSAAILFIISGAITTNFAISTKISSRVQSELPEASGIKARIPLKDMPQNLTSDAIKAVSISIDRYAFAGSGTDTSLAIKANNISKKQPTIVGSLDITATIPAATILENAEFQNAQIVGNTLQISVGAGGFGKALLTPKFSNNQIFFQLQSVSILGSQIPATSLPADIQNQIKGRGIRTLDVPKGLKVKAVTLSSKGLSINLRGTNIELGKLGSAL
jgi:hypothetical protein